MHDSKIEAAIDIVLEKAAVPIKEAGPKFASMMADALYMKIGIMKIRKHTAEEKAEVRQRIIDKVKNEDDKDKLLAIMDDLFPQVGEANEQGQCPDCGYEGRAKGTKCPKCGSRMNDYSGVPIEEEEGFPKPRQAGDPGSTGVLKPTLSKDLSKELKNVRGKLELDKAVISKVPRYSTQGMLMRARR